MHTVTLHSADDVSAFARAINLGGEVICIHRDDGDWDVSVPDAHTQDANAIVADMPSARRVGLKSYAANKRWKKEVGGIVVSSVPIATDDRSKQMILGARIAADADSGFSTEWVGADGSVYSVNAAQIVGISNAVLAHVAACFADYADIVEQIDSEAITTTAQIDSAFE